MRKVKQRNIIDKYLTGPRMLITNTLIFTQPWDSRYTKNMKYNDLAIVTEFGRNNKFPTMK